MAKQETKKRTVKSTSKKAKEIIRSEIRAYYNPKRKGGGRSSLENMKKAANHYNGGYISRYPKSDYTKGAALVDAAAFAIGRHNQAVMLDKIYGKDNVNNWDNDKIHNTYKHLIGREYDSMLRKKEKAKLKPKRKSVNKKSKNSSKK